MNALQEFIEDIEDLVALIARYDEPTISDEELLAELQREELVAANTED